MLLFGETKTEACPKNTDVSYLQLSQANYIKKIMVKKKMQLIIIFSRIHVYVLDKASNQYVGNI